jgi:hypothetical protein
MRATESSSAVVWGGRRRTWQAGLCRPQLERKIISNCQVLRRAQEVKNSSTLTEASRFASAPLDGATSRAFTWFIFIVDFAATAEAGIHYFVNRFYL